MNRIPDLVQQPSLTRQMGTLAIMGYAAGCNLRDVATAFGSRDLAALRNTGGRNAKQARLRAEIEDQIVEEMAHVKVGLRSRRELILISQIANMFERIGAQTVDISQLGEQVLRGPRLDQTADVQKLIEHAVYIADRAVAALVEDDVAYAKIAREQRQAATELHARINQNLATVIADGGESSTRAVLLRQITSKAYGMIEEAGRLADDVIAFLDRPEI